MEIDFISRTVYDIDTKMPSAAPAGRLFRNEVIQMATIDLSKYGITGTTEIIRNPSYEFPV